MTKTCQSCGKTFEANIHAHHAKRCPDCKRDYTAEYKRAWMLTASKFCDCGQPATTIFAGERCCERCKTIDRARIEAEANSLARRKNALRLELIERKSWRAISNQLQAQYLPEAIA